MSISTRITEKEKGMVEAYKDTVKSFRWIIIWAIISEGKRRIIYLYIFKFD